MILRRLSQSLREQNWTAIVIEFVLLVVGVLLAMQVNNWNQERLESRRAQEYLLRLSSDLEREQTSIDQRLIYMKSSIAYGEQALTFVEAGKLAQNSSWQTLLAFYQSSRILPYAPVDSTYQEMRSAGDLALVRNTALRTSLNEYFVSGTLARADYILRLNPEYRAHVRGLTPFRVARYIYTDCFRIFQDGSVAMLPCRAPVDEPAAAAVVQRYVDAPKLAEELAFWVDSAYQMTDILQKRRKTCVELKQRVDAEIARP